MHFSYYVTYRCADEHARIADADFAAIESVIRQTPHLRRAHLLRPENVSTFFPDDGVSPVFAMQLEFDNLLQLEAVIAADGHLQQLARMDLPSLAACEVEQQAMVTRPFPVPDPHYRVPAGTLPFSFCVHYPGSATDHGAWVNYYLAHHPQIMAFFPEIREIEVSTRVDWLDAMPWRRVVHMSRNKQIFDSLASLTGSMRADSPVRAQMRADYVQFPEFSGGNRHHVMSTLIIEPAQH